MPRPRFRIALLLVMALAAPAASDTQSNCAGTSTGRIPLIDLGAGTYHGFPGGLYGAGSNQRPFAHESAGLAIANAIVPLDTSGAPSPTGRIVLISIGMSNATQEFSTFVPLANADPARNPRVQAIDCAVGGQSADIIRNPAAAYWDSVRTRLRGHGSSFAQVQAVWIKEAIKDPTGAFPASADTLEQALGAIVRIIKARMPNVKLTYFTSRIYAGYATSALNPEPYAYESGFAVKWLIDAQIAGVDSLRYSTDGSPAPAPWLSWGPYLWADGLTPRSDGLTWQCSDFVTTDGTHPATSGREKVADSLLAFFHHDDTATPWYLSATNAVPAVGDGPPLTVWPQPARGVSRVSFTAPAGAEWRVEAVDIAGRRVADLARGADPGAHQVRWDASGMRPGVYWLRLVAGTRVHATRMVLMRP